MRQVPYSRCGRHRAIWAWLSWAPALPASRAPIGCSKRVSRAASSRRAAGSADGRGRCVGYFAQGQIAEHGGEFISLGQHDVQRLAAELGLQLINLSRREPGNDIDFFHGMLYPAKQAEADYLAQVRDPLHAAFRAAGYPTKYHQATPAGRALDHTQRGRMDRDNVPGGRSSKIGALLANGAWASSAPIPANRAR